MSYIDTETGEYPMSEADVRAACPFTSFSNRFLPPVRYALVFPTPKPISDGSFTVVEGKPRLTTKGHWEQSWEILSVPLIN